MTRRSLQAANERVVAMFRQRLYLRRVLVLVIAVIAIVVPWATSFLKPPVVEKAAAAVHPRGRVMKTPHDLEDTDE
jgi:hypothetical protein